MDPIEANPIATATFGQRGTINETGTTAVTGIEAFAIQILTDAVFSALTDASASGDAITGITLTAGTVIYGNFTAFTLTSGAARAYLK
jgi:hypothetical protein